MKWPWAQKQCTLCLTSKRPMSRAHVISRSIGGFLWAKNECERCNNDLGSKVEAESKNDDSVRIAIESVLAAELPELALEFANGQSYVRRGEHGVVHARRKDGEIEISSSTDEDGTLTQSPELARRSLETTLRRDGKSAEEIERLLAQFDAAPPGELVQLTDTLAARHGSVDGFDLPLDGAPVTDAFPAVIAWHLLALFFGEAIYAEKLNGLREAIRTGQPQSPWHGVEGYRPGTYDTTHLVGIAQTSPHIVVRVQLFGALVWRVHLNVAASALEPAGLVFDLKEKDVREAAPRPLPEPIPSPF